MWGWYKYTHEVKEKERANERKNQLTKHQSIKYNKSYFMKGRRSY